MRKIFITILTVVFSATLAIAADFASGNWGNTFKDVKKNEKNKIVDIGESHIAIKVLVSGIDMLGIYGFKNGKLLHGGYSSQGSHTNPELWIEDHAKIKAALIQKYGEPEFDQEIWKDGDITDHNSLRGMAVSLGRVEIATQWKTARSVIQLRLVGDNFKPQLTVFYWEKEYFEGLSQKPESSEGL